MSVLASRRKESKFEVITYSEELHDMLTQLMVRSFGVRDLDHFVRQQFACGKDKTKDFSKYRFLMHDCKVRIDMTASLLTSNVRAANSYYPKSLHELEQRRDYQNAAIANCEQLVKELQRVVKIFNVDLNIYGPYSKAIDREIGLIKRWRQHDSKIETYLRKKCDV